MKNSFTDVCKRGERNEKYGVVNRSKSRSRLRQEKLDTVLLLFSFSWLSFWHAMRASLCCYPWKFTQTQRQLYAPQTSDISIFTHGKLLKSSPAVSGQESKEHFRSAAPARKKGCCSARTHQCELSFSRRKFSLWLHARRENLQTCKKRLSYPAFVCFFLLFFSNRIESMENKPGWKWMNVTIWCGSAFFGYWYWHKFCHNEKKKQWGREFFLVLRNC